MGASKNEPAFIEHEAVWVSTKLDWDFFFTAMSSHICTPFSGTTCLSSAVHAYLIITFDQFPRYRPPALLSLNFRIYKALLFPYPQEEEENL
jgi:hypothetical protein